jgi:hypothetical protein
MSRMAKRLFTILFLIAWIGNASAARSPHPDGEGGCGTECCQAARQAAGQDGPAAAMSAVCCMTECGQNAETPTLSSSPISLKPRHPGRPAGCLFSNSSQGSYLQLTRFPISPTRFLYGSPHRYLDLGALLI